MFVQKRNYCFTLFCILLASLLSSCTSMQVNHSQPICLNTCQKIVVLPFTNMTETPQADERAASMTADLLRTKGMRNVVTYPNKSKPASLIPGVKMPIQRARLLAFARRQSADYAMRGDVTEWNYKVGLDGEPAVGLNLEVIDVYSGQVIWSAVGSESGGSRSALSEVALNLINSMLKSIKFIRA